MANPLVAPSILAADFGRLAEEVQQVQRAGADRMHCDVMDGHFVDNISFGPAVISVVRKSTSLPLEAHLMIEHADHYLPRFIEAGADCITVHVEQAAKHDVGSTLQKIRAAGRRAGLTLNPATPFSAAEPFLQQIDLLLVMTVQPGFGGQSFRPEMMEKVQRAVAWKKANGATWDVEVDGGINPETARISIDYGANVLVAGTSIFHTKNYAAAIRALRGG
jgi:ribulose-phosphate 3-epimerase